jgi:tetratricopeptide (TPR) repeat protein
MPERKPVRATLAVAAAALVVAAAAAAVGRVASGPVPTASAPTPATVQVPAAPPASGPAEAAQQIRRAKVQAELERVLAQEDPANATAADPAPGTAGAAPENGVGEDDPRLPPLRARLQVNPEDVDALLSVGYVYVEHHAYSKARGYYMRAAEVAPDNVEARTHLGTVAYFLGHLDEAMHHYEQALALDPDYAPAYFEMGAALRFGRHDLAGAVKAWEHFLALDPDAEEADRIRQLIAETRRMMAEGTAPAPHPPATAPAPEPSPEPSPEPFNPATAPWPGQQGSDRSQETPPESAPPAQAG